MCSLRTSPIDGSGSARLLPLARSLRAKSERVAEPCPYDGFDFSDSAYESYVAAPGISQFERWTGVESICIAAWWGVLISIRVTEMASGSLQVGPGQISSEAVGRSTPLLIASCALRAGLL